MRRITAVALVIGPLLFLVANVLHPKEYGHGHETQQLQAISEHYARWQGGHFLAFVAALIFVFAIAGLAWIVTLRRPLQGLAGGALGLIGLVAVGGVLALDGFTWGALGQVSTWPGVDHRSIELALHAVQQARWNLPFYVGSLALTLGLVVLAHGLVREQIAPLWAGAALAAGAVLVVIDFAVHSNVYFIVAAAVLALGGIGVGLALGDDDDRTSIRHVHAG